jgi:anti-sigma-K factor RskA
MQPDCEAARENIDAYAIGTLDADEARALEAHLATCDDCAALLEEAREGATAMALSVPLATPNSVLKARVMASAGILAGAPARPQPTSHWWQAAAAVLALASAGILTWGILMQRRVNDLESQNAIVSDNATAQAADLANVRADLARMTDFNTRLASTVSMQDAMVDVIAQPDVQRTVLLGTDAAPQATARYLWSPSEDLGALVTSALPALPEGKVYRMWIVYPATWVAGGDFTVDASGRGRLVVRPDEADDPAGASPLWFCVTLETPGSDPATRGEMVLRSQTN